MNFLEILCVQRLHGIMTFKMANFVKILLIFFIIFKLNECNDEVNSKDLQTSVASLTSFETSNSTISSSSSSSSNNSNSDRQPHQLWHSVGSSLTVQGEDINHYDDQSASYSSLSEESVQPPSRRRLNNNRKRKRRPQAYSTERVDIEQRPKWRGQVHDDPTAIVTDRNYTRQRNRQQQQHSTSPAPQIIREPLAALEKEQKLYEIRDKHRKDYLQPPLPSVADLSSHDKYYRKQYSQVNKDIYELSPPPPPSSSQSSFTDQPAAKSANDLKHILKNSGGLSLSEILQQKNLSLDDLLKGKYSALQAIQTTTAKSFALDDEENASVTSEVPIKITKPVRRIPPAYLPSSTASPNLNNRHSSQQSSIRQKNKKNSLRNQIRKDVTTKSTTEEVELETDESSNSPNINEMATIATLRDNPPVRKNIVYPSRSKLKILSTTGTFTTINRREMEKTTERIRQTTKRIEEITTTTQIPAYRRRASFRPKIKLPNLQKINKNDSSGSSSASSSSESMSKETHGNVKEPIDFNTGNNDQFIATYDSQEENSDNTNKLSHFYPSASSNEIVKTTTNKSNMESIEDKLKETNPEENFVENFENGNRTYNNSESNESEDIATLEELFGDASYNPEIFSINKHQVITPRIDRRRQQSSTKPAHNHSHKPDVTETNPSLFLDLTSDQSVDDRTELLELMEDRRSGNRLFKVLAQRNMTLEELIDHRRRGSSQLHLSEIMNSKASRVFPSSTKFQDDNFDIVTAFENFPHFNLIDLKSVKPDEIKTDSQGSSYFTSIIDIEPTDEAYKDGRSLKEKPSTMQAQQQHQEKLNVNDRNKHKSLNFFPSWKSLSLASYAAASTNENGFLDHHNSGHHISQPNDVDINDPIIKIEDDVVKAHDILDLELSGHGFKRNNNYFNNIDNNGGSIESIVHIPPGIQSAIVASSVIVTISIILFLFIFISCRWRQRRKKKLSYVEHYNALKNKLPAIISQAAASTSSGRSSNKNQHHRTDGNNCKSGNSSVIDGINSNNCSHLSTIMFHGSSLAANENCLSTMDPNSPEVHDYLFDTMRKSF